MPKKERSTWAAGGGSAGTMASAGSTTKRGKSGACQMYGQSAACHFNSIHRAAADSVSYCANGAARTASRPSLWYVLTHSVAMVPSSSSGP